MGVGLPGRGGKEGHTTRNVVHVRDGVRIHYRRLGAGPGMLLLHGFPQTGPVWRKVLPALAERFTVVAPAFRGHGDSDRPATGYDQRTVAGDMAEVIQALGIGPVIFVGHDRGARVGHRFALEHPTLLTHLVLLPIAPPFDIFERLDPRGARRIWPWLFQQVPDLPGAPTAARPFGPVDAPPPPLTRPEGAWHSTLGTDRSGRRGLLLLVPVSGGLEKRPWGGGPGASAGGGSSPPRSCS